MIVTVTHPNYAFDEENSDKWEGRYSNKHGDWIVEVKDIDHLHDIMSLNSDNYLTATMWKNGHSFFTLETRYQKCRL